MQDQAKIIKIVTISVVIFIFLLGLSLIINLIKITGLNNQKSELQGKLADLQLEIEQNEEKIAYMSTDTYVDQYAREYLGLIGKDEEAFIVK